MDIYIPLFCDSGLSHLLYFLQPGGNVVEMLPCDHEKSTFSVLCKTEATLVQNPNIDVQKTL